MTCTDCAGEVFAKNYCRKCYMFRHRHSWWAGPKPEVRPAHRPKQETFLMLADEVEIMRKYAREAYANACGVEARLRWKYEKERLRA